GGGRIDRDDHNDRRSDGDRMALVINRSAEAVSIRLPALGDDRTWLRVLDTARPEAPETVCGDFRPDIEPESIVAFIASVVGSRP
ncbi:MAG: hypothetical protein OXC25_10865, partial [Thiotrichales bacterium]|nr:hypothetical protein [Thiotrichales bacterium]